MFNLTNTYDKFTDEEISSLLAYSNICSGVENIRYMNGDSYAEVIKFESDLINGKFVYIPRLLPCPSWLRFDFDYICYMVEETSGNGAPIEKEVTAKKRKSSKADVNKYNIKINSVCCAHTLCKKRRSNASGVSYNYLLQLHQSSFIRQFMCKLYEMASSEKYQDLIQVSKCNDVFVKLIEKYSRTYLAEYFIPLLNAKQIYNGFLLEDEGIIRWNPNFKSLIFLPGRYTQFDLIFKNPYPVKEFSFLSIDGIQCNIVFSPNKATIQYDEPCHVDPANLVFNFNKPCSICWDLDMSVLTLNAFKVVNFKNISYPKRNWTENICFMFFSLYGAVPYNTESKEFYAFSALKDNFNLVYNMGESLSDSIEIWKKYISQEEVDRAKIDYHNDRIFTVLASTNYELFSKMKDHFNVFRNLIIYDLASLHPTEYVGSINYAFPMNAVESKKDFISKRIVTKKDSEDKFLVPIFLKPSGLTFNGFESFVSTYRNHSFIYENSYIHEFIEIKYNSEVIENFYPNCKNRPYGQEWWTYLASGKSALILFNCHKSVVLYMKKYKCSEQTAKEQIVKIWRDICVTARIASGLIWTRNVCHCPDSIFELEKNLSFISSYFFDNKL